MKKIIISLIIVVSFIYPIIAEESVGVIMIISPGSKSEAVSLDDLQLDVEVPVEGYAIIKATSFEFFDWLGYYGEGQTWVDPKRRNGTGDDADKAMLRIDITNLLRESKNFLENVSVKFIFDDYYEYTGWYDQFNYNNGWSDSDYYFDSSVDKGKQNKKWVVSKKDQFPIKPMYVGHYVFGCDLPMAVINSKAPLRMEITIDNIMLTYHIRK